MHAAFFTTAVILTLNLVTAALAKVQDVAGAGSFWPFYPLLCPAFGATPLYVHATSAVSLVVCVGENIVLRHSHSSTILEPLIFPGSGENTKFLASRALSYIKYVKCLYLYKNIYIYIHIQILLPCGSHHIEQFLYPV